MRRCERAQEEEPQARTTGLFPHHSRDRAFPPAASLSPSMQDPATPPLTSSLPRLPLPPAPCSPVGGCTQHAHDECSVAGRRMQCGRAAVRVRQRGRYRFPHESLPGITFFIVWLFSLFDRAAHLLPLVCRSLFLPCPNHVTLLEVRSSV